MPHRDRCCIFGDESSQNGHRYLVLGTTICLDDDCGEIEQRLEEAARTQVQRENDEALPELKWEKVKARNALMYRVALQTYVDIAKEQKLRFYGLVVDTSKLDHKTYSGGDAEVGFNKLFFSLLLKHARICKDNEPEFYVYLDDRTTRQPLEIMRGKLNDRAGRQYGLDYEPYKVLQFRKSHTEILIQITDVVAGAVAYQMNGHHERPSAAGHKVDLARQLAEMTGMPTLTKPTPYGRWCAVDLWHYDLSKAKRVPRA